jgi:predicted nucleotidyltransferase
MSQYTNEQLNMNLCRCLAAGHKHPLLFATISGAHLYGFPSPDSDYDLRGIHVLPLPELVGLDDPEETLTSEGIIEGVEIDLVTHDLAKFLRMMLKRNGYVLEQLLSPLVVQSGPEHQELIALAPKVLTRFHAHHYLGFAATQWNLFAKENPPRVKPLLYTYRVLLTGIHLMRAGIIEANLIRLNDEYKLPFIADLIARKTGGIEKQTLTDADLAFHADQYAQLTARLEREQTTTILPDQPTARPALNDLLIRVRLHGLSKPSA